VLDLYVLSRVGGGRESNETVHQLFIDFKKAYDLVRTEVLFNILMEFGSTHETSQVD
jgi:hypothetical protein